MTVFTRTTAAMSVFLLLSFMAVGQNSDDSITVESLVVSPTPDAVEFTINSSEWVRYTYFTLEGPRLVVDLHQAENALGFSRKVVGHAGVDQVRASFFTDAGRAATRLVFDLEEEIPYEVIDEGEGQVRVRFGVDDPQAVAVVSDDAQDHVANLGALDDPFEPGLFDAGDSESGELSDPVETRAAVDDNSTSTEAGDVDDSGIEHRSEDPEAVNLDAAPLEPALLEVVPKVLPGVEVVEVVDVEEIREAIPAVYVEEAAALTVVERNREASSIPIATPVLGPEVETSPSGQDQLASISAPAEFEIQDAARSIIPLELGSQEPVGVDSGALAQPATTVSPPPSIAELVAGTVPSPGAEAAPPPVTFMGQAVEPLATPQYTGEIATFDFRDLGACRE